MPQGGFGRVRDTMAQALAAIRSNRPMIQEERLEREQSQSIPSIPTSRFTYPTPEPDRYGGKLGGRGSGHEAGNARVEPTLPGACGGPWMPTKQYSRHGNPAVSTTFPPTLRDR
jgi:hypothetical protein